MIILDDLRVEMTGYRKEMTELADVLDRRSIEKVKNSLVRYGYDFTQINRAVKEYFENNYEEDN